MLRRPRHTDSLQIDADNVRQQTTGRGKCSPKPVGGSCGHARSTTSGTSIQAWEAGNGAPGMANSLLATHDRHSGAVTKPANSCRPASASHDSVVRHDRSSLSTSAAADSVGFDADEDCISDIDDDDCSATGSEIGLTPDCPTRASSASIQVNSGHTQVYSAPTTTTTTVTAVTSHAEVTAASSTEEVRKVSVLSGSLFQHCNPAVYFPNHGEEAIPLPSCLRSMLKWRMSTITPNVIKQWLKRAGFVPTKKKGEWLGYWGKHMKASGFRSIQPHQKINHFPGSFCIGRKDSLWTKLLHMQLKFGRSNYNFFPQTFVLPRDTFQLRQQFDDSGKQKWIIKPPACARGIGIHVINRWAQLPRKHNIIVQKYLDKPYLINGSKFDCRVYVYVTSYDPLRVYVYEDGLARFATCKYSSGSKHINNRFMHLTNYSVNKRNKEFTANSDETVCQGHKWGLKALWEYMDARGVDSEAVWTSIIDVVIKTIIASESPINSHVKQHVGRRSCVYELFGFDIFLDHKLKPYVLEVNISPSLHSNSKLDLNIKGSMLRDLLNMSGYNLPCRPDTPAAKVMQGMGYPEDWLAQPPPGVHLQPDEKAKHACYANCHAIQNVRDTILDRLTPDDVRVLMETEDEFQRRGGFLRVFPTTETVAYDNFFEIPRYYNILLNEWLVRYRATPCLGIQFLQGLAAQRVHLQTTRPLSEQWSPSERLTTLKLSGRLPLRWSTQPNQVAGSRPPPGKSLSSTSSHSVRSAATSAVRTGKTSSPAQKRKTMPGSTSVTAPPTADKTKRTPAATPMTHTQTSSKPTPAKPSPSNSKPLTVGFPRPPTGKPLPVQRRRTHVPVQRAVVPLQSASLSLSGPIAGLPLRNVARPSHPSLTSSSVWVPGSSGDVLSSQTSIISNDSGVDLSQSSLTPVVKKGDYKRISSLSVGASKNTCTSSVAQPPSERELAMAMGQRTRGSGNPACKPDGSEVLVGAAQPPRPVRVDLPPRTAPQSSTQPNHRTLQTLEAARRRLEEFSLRQEKQAASMGSEARSVLSPVTKMPPKALPSLQGQRRHLEKLA